jgi:two-component system, NarL family, response regulator LiaR
MFTRRQDVSEHEPIRVVVVDDHPMVRAGIAIMLLSTDDMVLVGEAADGEEAVQICAAILPDVVLMDLELPKMDGVSAMRELRQRCPSVQVLVLTTFSDAQRVQGAMRAGAVGYLLKAVERDELLDAIRAARKGRSTFSLEAIQALIQRVDPTAGHLPTPPLVPLTEREQEVLVLVVRGLHNDEIARQLVMTPATVKYHLGHLFAKLVVSTRTELVRVALQRHLCPDLTA